MSNKSGASDIAFSSASFASSIRPVWPSAAASQRYVFGNSGYARIVSLAASIAAS